MKADISINMDAKCSQCGEKGITESGLCLKCIAQKITEGGLMPGISITLPRIEEIVLKAKDGKVTIQFETMMAPGDIARLLNLQKSGNAIKATIESPQAQLDLIFNEVNVKTGEMVKVP